MPQTKEELKEAFAIIVQDAVSAHKQSTALEAEVRNLKDALHQAQEELRKFQELGAPLEFKLTNRAPAQQDASETYVCIAAQTDSPQITVRPYASSRCKSHIDI